MMIECWWDDDDRMAMGYISKMYFNQIVYTKRSARAGIAPVLAKTSATLAAMVLSGWWW